jgi:hypothetical protein
MKLLLLVEGVYFVKLALLAEEGRCYMDSGQKRRCSLRLLRDHLLSIEKASTVSTVVLYEAIMLTE